MSMLMIAIRCFVQYVVILACYAALPQFKPPLRERYLGVHVRLAAAARKSREGQGGSNDGGAYGARRGSRRGTWRRFVGRDAFDDDGYYRI